VARCGMEAHWKDNQPAAIPWENLSQKNSRCNEGMLLLSANLELQAQAFANAFTNAPHIIYVLRTQICLYMCMHFSIMSIYKLSGPWGTCLKSDCCMFHICSHHRQSNLTFVHPAIKRNRISSIYGGLKSWENQRTKYWISQQAACLVSFIHPRVQDLCMLLMNNGPGPDLRHRNMMKYCDGSV
jgi:hypothetical protein